MRELRQARGLSQTRLAELSGVSERTVRSIEGGTVGRPQHESLRRIAAVLAYGESHRARLVDRWTGASADRSPDEVGIPDWEVLYRRIRGRGPDDGGQISSVVCDVTIGPDRVPLVARFLHLHEAISATGSRVLWKLTGGLPVDASAVRFAVTTGGVVDDVFVQGDVAALAVRPDPVMARRGPFVLEYSIDYSEAARLDAAVDHEWMYGSVTPLQMAVLVVRFTGQPPVRLWPVQGATAATAERGAPLQPAADGSVQLCLRDLVGVCGIQWEWGDEAS